MPAHSGLLRRPGPPALAWSVVHGTRNPATLIVWCHGLGSNRSSEKARFFFDAFAARGWSVVRFDFTGHGESEGSTRELTLSSLIADLGDVVEAFAPARARIVLLGSSLGACTSAWFASRRPDLVAATVLLAPAFRFVPRILAAQGEDGARRWETEGSIRLRNRWIDLRLGWDLVRDSASYDDSILAATLATPTLIVHGADDAEVPVAESEAFAAAAAPGVVTLDVVPGGDHRLTAVKPRILARTLAWLAERGIVL